MTRSARKGARQSIFISRRPPGAPTDLFVEGRVANRPGDLLRAEYGSMSARPSKGQGSAQVYSLHLQSPPEEIPITFRLNSSLYDLGDRLEVTTDGLGYGLLQPVGEGVARLDRWEPEECTIAVMLETADGKAVKTFNGKTIRLEGIPPGRYHLKTALQSRRPIPETIATETFVVEIQNGPDWAVR